MFYVVPLRGKPFVKVKVEFEEEIHGEGAPIGGHSAGDIWR